VILKGYDSVEIFSVNGDTWERDRDLGECSHPSDLLTMPCLNFSENPVILAGKSLFLTENTVFFTEFRAVSFDFLTTKSKIRTVETFFGNFMGKCSTAKQIGTHQKQIGTYQKRIGMHQKAIGMHQKQIGTHQKQIGTHQKRIGTHPKRIGTH
jgi:hypothetical protein